MKLSLNKSSSASMPPQVLSAIKKYEAQAESNIRNSINKLTSWFIQFALNYKDADIPRLQLLSRAESLVINNVPQPRYLNSLFLEEDSVVTLIQQSNYLQDIGFILYKHLERKIMIKDIDYADIILVTVKTKTQQLLRKNSQKLQSFFGVLEVESFLTSKKRQPQTAYIINNFERQEIQSEAVICFNYIFKPLFEKKSLQNVYDHLYPMILWFVAIRDNTFEKQKTLLQMAKKIDSFLWSKKTTSNIHLINTFNNILDILSIKYLKDDSFSFQTLAPLLLKLVKAPLSDLINNWYSIQRDKKLISKQIQNIFRNSLNSGCTVFCFQIIQNFSIYLHRMRNYEILFHLFDSFIRKQYLNIKLPNSSFVRTYMNILMMYAIGFINRDRLDGQTQLDRLAVNLSELVCQSNFRFDNCYIQIIKFFRIYQNRFQFLSSTSRKFVSSLQQIYNVKFQIASLHQQVANRIFKQYSANYNQNQIYALQRSNRYCGLQNLGNTCYLNSFMQSLFMTKKFKSLVIKAQDEGVVPANHPIFEALVQLFTQLNSKTDANKNQVHPLFFKEKTPQPFRSTWEQHDTGQFGRMFLDSVTSQLKDNQLADKINRLFTHQIKLRIICKGCQKQREKKQKIFDYILNINENDNESITVSDLMQKYFQGYQLNGNNQIYCENCKGNRAAFVKPEPVQLAQYLIATVSIFKYDQTGSSKIKKPLNFEFSLNFKNILPKIINTDHVYELYAFILHIGTGVQRGHYQCFARNLQENPMLWYKFDDHYVTEQEINQIQDFHFGQNQTPYILFYASNKSRTSLTKQ